MVFRVLGDLEKIISEEDSIVPVMGDNHMRNIIVPGSIGRSRRDAFIAVSPSPIKNWYKIYAEKGLSVVSLSSYVGRKIKSKSLYIHESQIMLPDDIFPRKSGKQLIKAHDLIDVYADSQFVIDYYKKTRNFIDILTDRVKLLCESFPIELIEVIKTYKTVPLDVVFSGNLCLTIPPPPPTSSTPPRPY